MAGNAGQVERAGGAIAYEVIDHVPPWLTPARTVLFHHGLGTRSVCWDGWTPALAGRHRLVRFDMRGHGASPLPAGFRWSLSALVDDLLAVADATGAERFHLVGESTGGTVALAVAARLPERVLSVTVSNGAHRGGSIRNLEPWRRIIREEGMEAWSAHMMGQRFFDGALTDGMRRWYETRQADSDPDAILGATAMLVAVDLLPELERVTCPVLLLHPDSSPFIPVETMAELKRALPDARLQVFADARHGLPFSHAAECAAAVAEFIDRASPAEHS
ncbi:MAG: alpha/beta hydrolase [Chromatiales bacterium]|nr:alpha/beta hydrolase [Chromatiales bacterium]